MEDDEDARHELVDLLSEAGYDVIEAADGRQGLGYLTDGHAALPSLILVDLGMPVMSGWEFLAIIKSYLTAATGNF